MVAQAFSAAQEGLKFKGILSHRKSLRHPRQKPCLRTKTKTKSRSYFASPKRLSIQLFERLQITNLFPFLLPVFYSSAGDWRLKGEALEIEG